MAEQQKKAAKKQKLEQVASADFQTADTPQNEAPLQPRA